MTGTLGFISDIREVIPLQVKLPDGRVTHATQQGTVVLSPLLTILNVLFVVDCNAI